MTLNTSQDHEQKTRRRLASIMFKKQQFLFAEKVALVGTQWSSSIFSLENQFSEVSVSIPRGYLSYILL